MPQHTRHHTAEHLGRAVAAMALATGPRRRHRATTVVRPRRPMGTVAMLLEEAARTTVAAMGPAATVAAARPMAALPMPAMVSWRPQAGIASNPARKGRSEARPACSRREESPASCLAEWHSTCGCTRCGAPTAAIHEAGSMHSCKCSIQTRRECSESPERHACCMAHRHCRKAPVRAAPTMVSGSARAACGRTSCL